MFDADDALREYAQTGGPGLEADGRIEIGYIYATIRFESLMHPGYTSVECWAATSGTSRLFARSANIRKVFTDLTADSGGVCCLFDTGDGAPEQVCWLNGEPAPGDGLRSLLPGLAGTRGDLARPRELRESAQPISSSEPPRPAHTRTRATRRDTGGPCPTSHIAAPRAGYRLPRVTVPDASAVLTWSQCSAR